MNTINCRIKLNDHADVAGRNVTPAEVIVLRTLHDAHAGGCCIIGPVAAGKALTFAPGDAGESPALRDRTDAEEYLRLRRKYPQRESPDKPNSSFLDPLFPGVKTGTGKFPQSFDELPENYAIGAIGLPVAAPVRTVDKAEAVPVSEADGKRLMKEAQAKPEAGAEEADSPSRESLAKLNKDQLLALADDHLIPVNDSMKKSEIIAAILAKFVPTDAPLLKEEPVTVE